MLLLVSIAFVPCVRIDTATETETIQLDGFTVTLIGPEVDFPDSIEFKIEVEGESDVSDMTLQYRMDKLSVLPVTSVVFPTFTAGQEVTAEWKWDMTRTGLSRPAITLEMVKVLPLPVTPRSVW